MSGNPAGDIASEILEARPYLRAIDRTSRGLGRYDLTSFYAAPDALGLWVDDIAAYFSRPRSRQDNGTDPHPSEPVDAIVGLDALGFPPAGALAYKLGVPLILARKRGKVPLPEDELYRTEDFEDYSVDRQGKKGLEIRRDLLKEGMRVIVVDEWIDTGAQMMSLCTMLESHGVHVRGIATLQLKAGKSARADQIWERWDVFAANRTPLS